MRARGLLLLVLVAVVAVFAAAGAGGLVYDDLTLIARNPAVLGPFDLGALASSKLWGEEFAYWRPLTQLALWLGWQSGGTLGIHVISIALHLGSVAVVFALARRLGAAPPAAALAALLFGVHPAHVESVAWCSAINDPLWGLCALLAVRAALAAPPGRLLPSVALFCALGLLAKETAVTLPLLVVAAMLVRRATHADAPPWRWRVLLPLALVLLGWWVARAVVFGDLRAGFDRSPVALELPFGRMLTLRVELAGRLLWAGVAPWWPSTFRPMERALDPTRAAFLLPALVVAIAVGWVGWAWRRRHAVSLVGAALVLLPLLPGLAAPHTLNVYPVADRYLYVAAAGLALPFAFWLARSSLGRVAGLVLAAAFAVRCVTAIPVWHSQAEFIDVHVARYPDEPRLRYTQAANRLETYTATNRSADLDAAEASFQRAQQLVREPRYGGEQARARLEADIRVGLAWCALFREGQAPRPDFVRVLTMFARLVEEHETLAEAHIGLAWCLNNLGQFDAAERHLLRALEIDPSRTEAANNLQQLRRERR